MFKDIKVFLSSFKKKAKEHNLFKKYLGITLAGILAILIPIVIAILYIQFKDEPLKESQVKELSITVFDNDGHTIDSESVAIDNIASSPFVNIINNVLDTKTPALKPENFSKKPTFNLTVATSDTSLTYKCYFEKDLSVSFIEDNTGNFYLPREAEYTAFLNSAFSQKIYSESVPPSLTIGKDSFVLPTNAEWKYKRTDGTIQESTNFEIANKKLSYMIDGAIDFMFSESPSTCNIKITSTDGTIFFDGTLEETADFTANDGDKFTVIINAEWNDSTESLSFGNQSYEFDIICTKPSTIEITPQKVFGGSLVKISVSDVNNADTIVYTAKKPLNDDASSNKLYEFVPRFKKSGQNAYAYLPIPNDIAKGTFEFTVSYGIAKVDFTLSLEEISATTINLSEDASINITDKSKSEFSKIVTTSSATYGDIILFTSDFLSPEDYGFTKSIEYNSQVMLDEESSFEFFANSYTSDEGDGTAIKSANIGIVREIGYSELLGNYIAIDHGAGLYTWYCGLSDVNVLKGDILKKGEFIGRSGSTSLLCEGGVNIFCTLYGNLINPSDVLGKSLIQ